MKKIYLSALALVLGVGINAQVLNPSFENWTTGEPDNWTTLNMATSIGTLTDENSDPVMPALEVTTGATDGNSFITLTSFNLSGSANPQVPNGDYGSIATQDINSTDKYEDFSVDVMYDIKANDTAVITLQAYDASDNLVGVGTGVFAGTQATLSTVTIPMQYIGTVASYTMFIASSEGQIFQSVNSTIGVGSKLSVDNIVLGTVLSESDPATNLAASDVSDNGNGTDLQITFDAAADESTVSKYRVFTTAQGYSSGLSGWELLPAGPAFIEVTPDGSTSYTVNFTATSVYFFDNGGSPGATAIVENVPLEVVIYSMPDGTNTTVGTLSSASNAITLTSPLAVNENFKAVNVYPNPATNFVNFKVDGLENGTVTINSVTGQEVVNTSINGTEKVNVNHLNNGVYIYTVRNANGEVVKTNKLVIRK